MPILVNMESNNKEEVRLKMKETKTHWDYLSTFLPPEELSIEHGKIWQIEKLNEGSPDYDHVSKLFMSTINGIPREANPAPVFGKNISKIARIAKRPAYINPQPPMFGGGMNPGMFGGNPMGLAGPGMRGGGGNF
jgi:hypothetical protein